ncbi:MAG: hypothetical protein ACKOCB_08450 [Planctomycetia bacterium]
MAVLNIGWKSLARVAPKTVAVTTPKEGESASEPAEKVPAPRADKPMLVYVASPTPAEGFDKVEKVVLTEDKIVIGSKAFTCVRMSDEQAAQDPILAAAGKETPRIVIISADYQDVESIEGDKISIGRMWDAMKASYKAHYKGDLEKMTKSMLKVLGEFDKIANERKILEEKKSRAEKPSDADKKEWDKEAKELAEREKDANAERDALLKLERKQDEKAAKDAA